MFVRLTFGGDPILMNANLVMSVEPLEDGSRITNAAGMVDVDEPFDTVCDLLLMATETEVDQ